ncbi:MAG: sarcosine oxidase subunit gamma [Rhizobiaceae bacterium]
MAKLQWNEAAPLQAVAEARRHGVSDGDAGVTAGEIRGFQLVLLLARRGQADAMRKTAKTQFGADPGNEPRAVSGKNGCTMIWSGPDQFYALTPKAKSKPVAQLQSKFAKSASISDQSNGRSLIRISGPNVRDCLCKMLSVDLHPDVFSIGDAVSTQMAHMAVNVWRDKDDAFSILVFTSFAESLWRAILDHGAEFGIDIETPEQLS